MVAIVSGGQVVVVVLVEMSSGLVAGESVRELSADKAMRFWWRQGDSI